MSARWEDWTKFVRQGSRELTLKPVQTGEHERHIFHRQFQAVTGMSPLQYQKTLRFQEARRLMLTARLDAGERRPTRRVREPVSIQPRVQRLLRELASQRRRSVARSAYERVDAPSQKTVAV